MLKDRDYDVTPHIILILSLTLTQNARGVGEGLRGVLWRWVLVGVVGVRSRWVGGGDPEENRNLNCVECWMVDWYLRCVDDLIVRSRFCSCSQVMLAASLLSRPC